MLYTLSGIKLKLATIATLQYSLNIAFTIKDFSTQLAIWQNAIIAIILQSTALSAMMVPLTTLRWYRFSAIGNILWVHLFLVHKRLNAQTFTQPIIK